MSQDNQFEISKRSIEDAIIGFMGPINREQRRQLKKLKRKNLGIQSKLTFQSATSTGEILDNEDDLPMLERELTVQEALDSQLRVRRQTYNAYRGCGVTEPTARRYAFLQPEDGPLFNQVNAELDTKKFLRASSLFRRLKHQLEKTQVLYVDGEEKELTRVMREGDFPADVIFDEAFRSRRETIGLMRMQIDWLKQEPISQKAQDKDEPVTDVTEAEPVMSDLAMPAVHFTLRDWQVLFSERPWSVSPSGLVLIGTNSEVEALRDVDHNTRRFRSIKASSVLRALNHHLFDRDTIQKALATRFRYASEQERDWVKVKRGKDRLGLLIDEDSKKVVFCIEGRDIVYRNS